MSKGKIRELVECRDYHKVDNLLTEIGLRVSAIKQRTQFLYDILGVESVYLSDDENESDDERVKTKYAMVREILVTEE